MKRARPQEDGPLTEKHCASVDDPETDYQELCVRAPSLRGAIGRGHAKARLLPRLRVLPRVLLPWVLLPHVSLLPPQDFCGHELTPRLRKVGTPASTAVKAHIEKVRTPTAGGELHCPPASRALSLSDWLSTYNVIIAWRLRRTGA